MVFFFFSHFFVVFSPGLFVFIYKAVSSSSQTEDITKKYLTFAEKYAIIVFT